MPIGRFNLRGLLQDEEFLLGAGLLTAGSQGQNIGQAAFPSMIQAAKTSAIFREAAKKEETKKFIDEYKKTLPEGNTLRTLFEINPDKALDFITKLEVAKINQKSAKTNAMRNADALGLTPGTKEYNDFISAVTIKSDLAWQSRQGSGQVMSKGDRDRLVIDNATISKMHTKLKQTIQDIKDDPSLVGGMGTVRRWANKLGTLAEDVGVDMAMLQTDFALDDKIPGIVAIENALVAGYAKTLYPGKQITKPMLQAARDTLGLTGLTGSGEVLGRLNQIDQDFADYIETNRILLGYASESKKSKKKLRKYKIGIDGKLVEVKEELWD